MRAGQILFREIDEARPLLAQEISGTEVDPFYLDSRIEACLEFVERKWVD